MRFKWKSLFFILCAFFLLSNQIVQASENKVNKEHGNCGVQYSVNKIKSKYETDESHSYFDLHVKPGDQIVIESRIHNSYTNPIKIKQQALTTFTNDNGEISYTSKLKDDQFDKSLKIKFSEISQIDRKSLLVVEPNSDKIVTMKINVPKDAQDGVILGSWYFEKENRENKDNKKEAIQIHNKYSYAIGVKLTVNKEIEKPNLNLLSVDTGLSNYHKAFKALIQNDRPAIISRLNINAKITKKDNKHVLFRSNRQDIIMAPNSNFNYPIMLGDKKLKPGEYTLYLQARTNDPKWQTKSWKWKKNFRVSAEESKNLNAKAINDNQQHLNLWWILLGTLLFVLILILLILYNKIRKYKQKLEQMERGNAK